MYAWCSGVHSLAIQVATFYIHTQRRNSINSISMSANPVLTTCYAALPHCHSHVTISSPAIASFAHTLVSSPTGLPIPSSSSWAEEPLHPVPSQHDARLIADWVFLVSLLNFSFWSERSSGTSTANGQKGGRYAVRWKDGMDSKGKGKEKDWTGYWSLPAAFNRGTSVLVGSEETPWTRANDRFCFNYYLRSFSAALEEGIPITTPSYWLTASDEELVHVFRPSPESSEDMPLLETRLELLRQAGQILESASRYSYLLGCSVY